MLPSSCKPFDLLGKRQRNIPSKGFDGDFFKVSCIDHLEQKTVLTFQAETKLVHESPQVVVFAHNLMQCDICATDDTKCGIGM